jgi:hypothetical protein
MPGLRKCRKREKKDEEKNHTAHDVPPQNRRV